MFNPLPFIASFGLTDGTAVQVATTDPLLEATTIGSFGLETL
jgi:hypothetical protein